VGPEIPERESKTNVIGASRLSNFWNVFVWRYPKDFPSRRGWRPWTKPGYITMTRRQSNKNGMAACSGSPRLKKFRMQKSPGQVLASVFWDQDVIILIDYLSMGRTINAEHN
jgi:hypothetical protein